MTAKMMQAEATKNKDVDIDTLMSLLGRYYQIRDDYLDIMGLVCISLASLSGISTDERGSL